MCQLSRETFYVLNSYFDQYLDKQVLVLLLQCFIYDYKSPLHQFTKIPIIIYYQADVLSMTVMNLITNIYPLFKACFAIKFSGVSLYQISLKLIQLFKCDITTATRYAFVSIIQWYKRSTQNKSRCSFLSLPPCPLLIFSCDLQNEQHDSIIEMQTEFVAFD